MRRPLYVLILSYFKTENQPLPPYFFCSSQPSLPYRTRDDIAAAAAPAAAAVRFLSRCLLLHAVKFTRKGDDAEAWLAVAAMGVTQSELKAAIGYDFYHVMNRAQGTMQVKLKPAGFTVSLLQAFCGLSCVSMLDDSFGFTLKSVRDAGVTVKMLLQEELRIYPDVSRRGWIEETTSNYRRCATAKHFGQPKLKWLSDFIEAGYTEAEVRAASAETGVPVFVQGANHDDRKL